MILPLVVFFAALLASVPVPAADAAAGRALAQEKCASCHAISRVGQHHPTSAPKFRGWANQPLKEPLPVMLRRATSKKHGGAKPFALTAADIDNLVAHIQTLTFR